MVRSRTALTLFLAVICLGSARADSVRWQIARTGHFIIYHSPGESETAARAGEIAERWRPILARRLEVTPSARIPIYLYPDRRTFARDTGIQPSDPLVGLAHLRSMKIRIDSTGAMESMDRVIPHELVHILVYMKLRDAVDELPLWMHEGLAKYLGDDWSGADAELLTESAWSGRLFKLEEISESFPDDKRLVSVAYVQGYSAVKFMVDRYRPSSVPVLLEELARSRSFPSAMRYSLGVSPERFEAEWQRMIWERYSLGRWVKLASAAVSVSMALFAVLAYRRYRYLKRRKIEQFEREARGEYDEEDE